MKHMNADWTDVESRIAEHGTVPANRRQAGGFPEIRDFLDAVRRRGSWIVAAITICIAAAGAYIVFSPKEYASTVELFLNPKGLKVVEDDITGRGSSAASDLIELQSQQHVIKSTSVLSRVVDREELDRHSEFGNAPDAGIRSTVKRLIGLGPNRLEKRAKALDRLYYATNVWRNDESYVVSISVTTGDPKTSADVANAIAEVYLETEIASRADIAKKASKSLFSRADELRNQVRIAEEQLEAYKAEHNIVGARGSLVSEQQLSDVSARLVSARAATAEAKAKYDQIKSLRVDQVASGAITEAVESPTISSLRAQYAEIARQEAELATKYGASHPYVREISAQLLKYDRLIREELLRIVGAAENDYLRAKAKEQSLADGLEGLKDDTLETNQAIVRLRELQRDAASKREVYQEYLNRAKQLEEQQTVNTMNARIISPAIPATHPNGPSKPLVLAAALLAGLGIGTGAIWLREQFVDADIVDTELAREHPAPTMGAPVGTSSSPSVSVENPEPTSPSTDPSASAGPADPVKAERSDPVAARASLDYPVLGFVPSGRPPTIRKRRVGLSLGRRHADNVVGLERAAEQVFDLVWQSIRAPFRNLARRLDATLPGRRPRQIIFLSPRNHGEHASVVTELARALVDVGSEVMLVDGDPGERHLSRVLGLRRQDGFLEVLNGQCRLIQALWVDDETDLVILPMSEPSQDGDGPLIPAGTAQDDPAVPPGPMPELMMIVGESPVNAKLLPTLLGRADDIILTLDHTTPDRSQIEELTTALGEHSSKIRGAIIVGA